MTSVWLLGPVISISRTTPVIGGLTGWQAVYFFGRTTITLSE